MKYIKQFFIIILISFIGEILNELIPLPIPASIYGIIILFLCLQFKIVKLKDVKDVSVFFIDTMPLMFIPPCVGLMTSWNIIKADFVPYITITVTSTFVVMIVSGLVTQAIIRKDKKKEAKDE